MQPRCQVLSSENEAVEHVDWICVYLYYACGVFFILDNLVYWDFKLFILSITTVGNSPTAIFCCVYKTLKHFYIFLVPVILNCEEKN